MLPSYALGKNLRKANLSISKDKKSPLIARLSKTKSRHNSCKTKKNSYSRIAEVSNQYITKIKDNTKQYILHGLRFGMPLLQQTLAYQID